MYVSTNCGDQGGRDDHRETGEQRVPGCGQVSLEPGETEEERDEESAVHLRERVRDLLERLPAYQSFVDDQARKEGADDVAEPDP